MGLGPHSCNQKAPVSAHPNEIDKWLGAMKKPWSAEKKKHFQTLQDEITAFHAAMPKVELQPATEKLRTSVIAHGMPVKMAGNMSFTGLVTCLAAALTWAQ